MCDKSYQRYRITIFFVVVFAIVLLVAMYMHLINIVEMMVGALVSGLAGATQLWFHAATVEAQKRQVGDRSSPTIAPTNESEKKNGE